jgi:hypothetical protein
MKLRDGTWSVSRILHESMDLQQHIPETHQRGEMEFDEDES